MTGVGRKHAFALTTGMSATSSQQSAVSSQQSAVSSQQSAVSSQQSAVSSHIKATKKNSDQLSILFIFYRRDIDATYNRTPLEPKLLVFRGQTQLNAL